MIPRTIHDLPFLSLQSSAMLVSPATSDWVARVQTNGGAKPSAPTIAAVDIWYKAIVAAGIDSMMISNSFFAPDNLIASITPFFKVAGNDPWTNHNFVGGDLSASGLLGDTSTKYLDTGCNPSSIYSSDNDAGFTLYGGSIDVPLSVRMNAYNGGAMAGLYNDGSSSYTGAYGAWNTSFTISALFSERAFGWVSANRTASNAVAIYRANSAHAFATGSSAAGAPGGRPNLNLWLNCWNYNGTPSQFPGGGCNYSSASIHHGLTSGQAQALFNADQALRIAFGGGYS